MHGPSGSDIGMASILLSIIAIALAVVGIASGGGSTPGNLPDSGTVQMVMSAGTVENCTCIFGVHVNFHQTFTKPPSVTLTLMNDSFAGVPGSGYLVSSVVQTDSHSIITSGNVGETWAAMPAALTEIFGNTRNRASVGQDNTASQYLFSVNVVTAGSASAVLRVQFSTDGTTWVDPTGGGCDLSIAGVGLFTVGPFPCSFTANIYPFARIVGQNGNGIASPSFGLIELQMITTITPAVTLKVCETSNPPLNTIGCDGSVSIGVTTTQFDFAIALTLPSTSKILFVIQWHAVICQQTSCTK